MYGRSEELSAAVIVIDDRIKEGERPDTSGPRAVTALEGQGGIAITYRSLCRESYPHVFHAITEAMKHARFILTIGGTGLRPGSVTPEVTQELISQEVPGIATQILLKGLQSTERAGLCRGAVGVTEGGHLIVNAPGSQGGVKDTLEIILPLLAPIFNQVDELD
ncbi:MAG TPA: hypothetical protein H9867_00845 [Candidatus Corynebacterium gallistercoris]|uniref:MoaB/Mog domain-containing protein n=1 Tax=Candidatus Corynebacterium gallistercoris TaxID=2838530 RepID=A0A9D1UQA0_9CORY|nr:hypothetical protein [Candidatus Corynebacterium gallistercoris]